MLSCCYFQVGSSCSSPFEIANQICTVVHFILYFVGPDKYLIGPNHTRFSILTPGNRSGSRHLFPLCFYVIHFYSESSRRSLKQLQTIAAFKLPTFNRIRPASPKMVSRIRFPTVRHNNMEKKRPIEQGWQRRRFSECIFFFFLFSETVTRDSGGKSIMRRSGSHDWLGRMINYETDC